KVDARATGEERMRSLGRLVVLLSLCALGPAGGARAADPAPEYSPGDFVKAILSGPAPCPPGRSLEACEANPKTRRFTLVTAGQAAHRGGPAGQHAAPHAPKLSSADVLVPFALGSAEITPQ